MVAAGASADALALAGRVEREARARKDNLGVATARLIRAVVESRAGDSAKAIELAKEAEASAREAADPYLTYWAAMTVGVAARGRGRLDESVAALRPPCPRRRAPTMPIAARTRSTSSRRCTWT